MRTIAAIALILAIGASAHAASTLGTRNNLDGMDVGYDVASGADSRANAVSLVAYIGDAGATGDTDLIADGGHTTSIPSASGKIGLLSGSTGDSGTGTGLRTVTVSGLDANYDEQSETVTLDGTSGASTTNSYVRLFSVKAATAGSGGANAGAITVTDVAGIRIGYIAAGDNRTRLGSYTVPDDHLGYVTAIHAGVINSGTGDVALQTRTSGGVWMDAAIVPVGAAVETLPLSVPLQLAAKTDVRLVLRNASAANVKVVASVDMFIVND